MSRIVKQGADWLNPTAPMTGWQRERERGVIQPMDEIGGWRVPAWCWAAVPFVLYLVWQVLP